MVVLGAAVLGSALCAAALRGSGAHPATVTAIPSLTMSDGRIQVPDGYTVRYTLDGSLPDERASVYTGGEVPHADARTALVALVVPTSIQWRHPVGEFPALTVVRACAFDDHGGRGPVLTYTVPDEDAAHELPVLSVVMPWEALFDPDSGIYVVGNAIFHDDEAVVQRYPRDPRWWKYPGNFHMRGRQWERAAHLEWFEPDGSPRWRSDAEVRVSGNNTRGFPQHALRLSFEGAGMHGPDHHASLVLRAAGNDQDRAFMRDAVQHALCGPLGFETSDATPCVVYINGAYWGIHELRERIDADELALRHGIKKKKFTVLEDRGLLDHGDSAEIPAFKAAVARSWTWDHRAPTFIDSVGRLVDLDGFLTYMAAQVILGNSDWPDQNVKYWRYTGRPDSAGVRDGRWRFVMGDSDMGLGFNGGSAVDLLAHMRTQSGPVAGLFLSCMRNRTLRERFRARVDQLLNGPLSAAAIEQAIDRHLHALRPEMPCHIRRWRRPLTMAAWLDRVEELKRFARERPAIVRAQLDRHLPPRPGTRTSA